MQTSVAISNDRAKDLTIRFLLEVRLLVDCGRLLPCRCTSVQVLSHCEVCADFLAGFLVSDVAEGLTQVIISLGCTIRCSVLLEQASLVLGNDGFFSGFALIDHNFVFPS